MEAFALVAAATGCRAGELCGLQWQCVDMDTGTALIRQAVAYLGAGKPLLIKGTKTGVERTVALDDVAVAALRSWRVDVADQAPGGHTHHELPQVLRRLGSGPPSWRAFVIPTHLDDESRLRRPAVEPATAHPAPPTCAIDERLMRRLEAPLLPAGGPSGSPRFRQASTALSRGVPLGPWVFTPDESAQTPWSPAVASMRWSRHCAARGHSGVGLHKLRHWFASASLEGGMSPQLVARQLGHSTPAITLKVYAHVVQQTPAVSTLSDAKASAERA